MQVTKQLASAKKSWQERQQEVGGIFTKPNGFGKMTNNLVSTVLVCVLVLEYVSLISLAQLERKWERKLEEAMKEKQKAKCTETQDDCTQTDTVDSVSPLLSLEQLEERLSAQRMVLQRESDSKLTKAVEEAVRGKERELQQKHVQDMTLQVSHTQNFDRYLGLVLIRQKSKLLV